jgi:hypothetical protein
MHDRVPPGPGKGTEPTRDRATGSNLRPDAFAALLKMPLTGADTDSSSGSSDDWREDDDDASTVSELGRDLGHHADTDLAACIGLNQGPDAGPSRGPDSDPGPNPNSNPNTGTSQGLDSNPSPGTSQGLGLDLNPGSDPGPSSDPNPGLSPGASSKRSPVPGPADPHPGPRPSSTDAGIGPIGSIPSLDLAKATTPASSPEEPSPPTTPPAPVRTASAAGRTRADAENKSPNPRKKKARVTGLRDQADESGGCAETGRSRIEVTAHTDLHDGEDCREVKPAPLTDKITEHNPDDENTSGRSTPTHNHGCVQQHKRR